MPKQIGPKGQTAGSGFGPQPARRPPFDRVTIGLHWATALLVLTMFVSAWLRLLSHDDVTRAVLLHSHRSVGLALWIMTAGRLAWRLTNAKLPPFPAGITKAQRRFIHFSEYGLYILLLGQPATGLGVTLLSGRPFALFAMQFAPLMPQDTALWEMFRQAHYLSAWALGALVAIHAISGLVHHFVLHDDVLECMAPLIAVAPGTGITPTPS